MKAARFSWRTGILLLAFILAGLFCIRIGNNPYFDGDTFWHARTGQDWVRNGLSPWTDHYSFTFLGKPVIAQPVVFQVALHLSQAAFGELQGIGVLNSLLALLGLGVFAFLVWRYRPPLPVSLLGLLFLVIALCVRPFPRPERTSYFFTLWMTALLFQARKRISVRSLLGINLLLVAWLNVHVSGLVGYVLIGSLYFELALRLVLDRNWSQREWGTLAGFAALTFAVGWLNPDGQHVALRYLHAVDWSLLIQEYVPLEFRASASWVRAALALVPGLIVLCGWLRIWSAIPALLFFSYQSFQLAKMAPLALLVAVPFAVLASAELSRELWLRLRPLVRAIAAAGALAVAGVCINELHSIAQVLPVLERIPSRNLPVDVAQYMQENRVKGRVWNEYVAGGYLLYALAPDIQVFIDGRTNVLYPYDFVVNYLRSGQIPAEFTSTLKKYQINQAVLSLEPKSGNPLSIASYAGDLSIEFAGESYAFLRSGGDRVLPLASRLFSFPECWNPAMSEVLRIEAKRGIPIMPPKTQFRSWLEFMSGYLDSLDPPGYLREELTRAPLMDRVRRMGAFLSVGYKDAALAYSYFASIREKTVKDSIAMAQALVEMGNMDGAENLLADEAGARSPQNPEHANQIKHLLDKVKGEREKLWRFSDEDYRAIAKLAELYEPNRKKLEDSRSEMCWRGLKRPAP